MGEFRLGDKVWIRGEIAEVRTTRFGTYYIVEIFGNEADVNYDGNFITAEDLELRHRVEEP